MFVHRCVKENAAFLFEQEIVSIAENRGVWKYFLQYFCKNFLLISQKNLFSFPPKTGVRCCALFFQGPGKDETPTENKGFNGGRASVYPLQSGSEGNSKKWKGFRTQRKGRKLLLLGLPFFGKKCFSFLHITLTSSHSDRITLPSPVKRFYFLDLGTFLKTIYWSRIPCWLAKLQQG